MQKIQICKHWKRFDDIEPDSCSACRDEFNKDDILNCIHEYGDEIKDLIKGSKDEARNY